MHCSTVWLNTRGKQMTDGKITIIRAPRDGENPYCMIRRGTLQDSLLSFETRGMLGYLLSKPRDWRVVVNDLMIEIV
jgi:hypothetical protein